MATTPRHVILLKGLLLAFWASWHTLVFATNLGDGAKALGLLGQGWAFASGNYRFLVETTARYGTPSWLNGLLFGGVLCWEGAAPCSSGWPFGAGEGKARGCSTPPSPSA
jgi:hypothetical protein